MEEKINLKEKVDYLYAKDKPKRREMRIPGKGKVSRSKMKKGFMIICRIDDNKNVAFEKKKVEEGTYRLSTGECHSTNEEDIFSYKGKPMVFQPVKKLNPYNPLKGKNETYGQKIVMARMIGDTIKVKKGGGSVILWIALIGAAIFAFNYFSGGA